jgi:hypothetical protein
VTAIPAPLLSRQVGVVVVVLSVLTAVALTVLPPLGFWPFVGTVVLAAIHSAFLALAVLLIGRTGLAGRHSFAPVAATFGSAAMLLLVALAEIALVVVAGVVPGPPPAWFGSAAGALAAAAGLTLALFGVAVARAAVVRPGVRILPLVGGLAVLVAAVALFLYPDGAGRLAIAVASLLLGGIGVTLFTPRTLR